MMFPVKRRVRPWGNTGPIINRAEMYCELTLPAKDTSRPSRRVPVMRKGGNPSCPAYSIRAPRLRRASTRMPMGRCCIRGVPVRRRVPGVTLRQAVRKRIAVPAAPMSTVSDGCSRARITTRVSSQSLRFSGRVPPPDKAWRMRTRLLMLFEAGNSMAACKVSGAWRIYCIVSD